MGTKTNDVQLKWGVVGTRQTHKRNLGGLYNAKNPTYTSYKPIRQYDDPEGHTINPRPKDEYERYLEETQGETPSPTGKYYW